MLYEYMYQRKLSEEMLWNERKRKPGLSANRPSNNWAQKGRQVWLYFNQRTTMYVASYVGNTTNLEIVLDAQKILTKFSYPKKFFEHPHHLKSGVPPPHPLWECLLAQMTPCKVPATKPIDSNFPLSVLLLSSLRKQPTFGNATTGFPTK